MVRAAWLVLMTACAQIVDLGDERSLGAGGSATTAGVGAGGASSLCPDSNGMVFASCSQLETTTPVCTPSGTYRIDPDGPGPLEPFDAYCELDTDGGGWTLVMNYLHLHHTNPPVTLRNANLPLYDSRHRLGTDDNSGTIYWGHASPALLDALAPTELWFQGTSTLNARKIDFKTSHSGCLSYMRTGLGSCAGIEASFTPFADHTAHLPAEATHFLIDKQDLAMLEAPFYKEALYHWNIMAWGERWEVDDWSNHHHNTYHLVHARSALDYPLSCSELLQRNPSAQSAVYAIDRDGAGPAQPAHVYCNF